MVGILLKIGKQSENVREEEVFGRFCIRDITENIYALWKSGFAPCSVLSRGDSAGGGAGQGRFIS